MIDNEENFKAALIELGLKEGATITEIRAQYLDKTSQIEFQSIILGNEALERDFQDIYKAYVTLVKHFEAEGCEDLQYYPPDQVFQFHFNQGLYYLISNNHIKAGEKLQAAYNMNPKSALVHIYLGILLLKRKSYYAAEKYFKDAAKLDNHCDDAWFYLGECYYKAGEIRKAQNMYEVAKSLNPGRKDLALRLKEIREKLGGKKDTQKKKPSFFQRLFGKTS